MRQKVLPTGPGCGASLVEVLSGDLIEAAVDGVETPAGFRVRDEAPLNREIPTCPKLKIKYELNRKDVKNAKECGRAVGCPRCGATV
jgi:hypothetical protein